MKNNYFIIFIIILILTLPLCLAGDTISLDFSEIVKTGNNLYTPVKEGDRIVFQYDNKERTVLIGEFNTNYKTNKTSIDINVYSFENTTTPFYGVIIPGSITKLDINKDGKKDIQLEVLLVLDESINQKGYFLIDEDGTPSFILSVSLSNESSLDLVKIINKNNLNIKPFETKTSFFKSKLLIMPIIFVALIITGYFILRKPKKNEIAKAN